METISIKEYENKCKHLEFLCNFYMLEVKSYQELVEQILEETNTMRKISK